MKKRAVVICPGRGTYTSETLGYLKSSKADIKDFIADIDSRRKKLGEPTISELDNAEKFSPGLHTRGEHASSLIYACSYADFMSINRDEYEIVAITGNSMGWYLTLAYGGALDWAGAFEVINTMGSMMKQEIIGGQIIYPIVDENWHIDPAKQQLIEKALQETNGKDGMEAHHSIFLGGYAVIGGNKSGLQHLLKTLPKIENYPFQLINHAAFHTPLLKETSRRAFEILPVNLFQNPKIPLIDGRGKIWMPYSTNAQEIYEYTLGHQVYAAYDFTKAITVALKEFAPDKLILLGPGSTLGGAIGQTLIMNQWAGIKSKADFSKVQKENPYLLAMGMKEQRQLVT